jgi:hypothetical protein
LEPFPDRYQEGFRQYLGAKPVGFMFFQVDTHSEQKVKDKELWTRFLYLFPPYPPLSDDVESFISGYVLSKY